MTTTSPRRRPILSVAAAAFVVALALTGCTSPTHSTLKHDHHSTATVWPTVTATPTGTPTAKPTAPASTGPLAPVTAPAMSTIATAQVASVPVYPSPTSTPTATLANPQANGAPLVFLVLAQQPGWVKVALAERPNGSTGWVRDSNVKLATTSYALVATTETNTLVLYRGGVAQRTFTVATGTGGTPTPHGSFYLTELLAPTNSGYGPYAYGLSAFSDVLNSFGGGPGQIGLHGTNEASSIGQDASHGCIRLQNTDITYLAKTLPLGTPIQIR